MISAAVSRAAHGVAPDRVKALASFTRSRRRDEEPMLLVCGRKNDPPDYSVAGEGPVGSCHREGTFERNAITLYGEC